MNRWLGWCAAATLALVSVVGAGCGSDDGGGNAGSSGTGGSGATGGGGSGGSAGSGGSSTPLCTPGSGAIDLAGQWAVQANLDVKIVGNPASLVELCPDPQTQPALLILKLDVTGSGTSFQQTVSVCEIQLPTVIGGVGSCNTESMIETEIKPGAELAAYLPQVTIPNVAVTLGAAEVGQSYDPDPFALVLGASLANAATDPLPFWDVQKQGCTSTATSPQPADCVVDLAKVTDEDQDSVIGVTLQAYAEQNDGTPVIDGTAAAVLRVAPTLSGTIQNAGCVDGTLGAKLEYSIVDSDVTLTGAPITTPRVIEQLPPFEILPSSKFRMLRASGEGDYDFDDDDDGTVTCAEIKNHVDAFSF